MFVAMLFDRTFDNFISSLVADIDIESEKYWWIGSAKIDFYVSRPKIPMFDFYNVFCGNF